MTDKYRWWCITWNNPEICDRGVIRLCEADRRVKYAVFQRERGENTEHYQMYVELNTPVRLAALKSIFDTQRLHAEVRRGTRDQARAYCMKEDTRISGPWEYGTYAADRLKKSSVIEAVVEGAKEGKSFIEVYEEHGASVFLRKKEYDLARSLFKHPRPKPLVVVHFGESGTGKTTQAEKAFDGEPYFRAEEGKWWTGYDGEENIILDEFYGGIEWPKLLRMLDRGHCTVETKGAATAFMGKFIHITSNQRPELWYPTVRDLAPLYRRINKCYEYYTTTSETGTVIAKRREYKLQWNRPGVFELESDGEEVRPAQPVEEIIEVSSEDEDDEEEEARRARIRQENIGSPEF